MNKNGKKIFTDKNEKVFIIKKFLKSIFKTKEPIVKDNTFIVWEPCSQSHSEVVPGYVKYLIDLGYNVSVLVNPDRLKEGLFSRFKSSKVFLNKMNKKQIYNYFKNNDLKNIKISQIQWPLSW